MGFLLSCLFALPLSAGPSRPAKPLTLSDRVMIRLEKERPEIVHAFDLIYGGIEICSGTQRIHKPELLREQLKTKGLDPDAFTYYTESFAYGAPPHAGWSIGLERLTMAVTGMKNIRECCMFPRDRDRLVP